MKLEQQVCSLELAQKLKSLGVRQESLFYWVVNSVLPSDTQIKLKKDCGSWKNSKKIQDGGSIKYYSAFTVAELFELLPDEMGDEHEDLPYTLTVQKISDYYRVAYEGDRGVAGQDFEESNLGDAMAEMLVYLLENNLITL